MKISNAFETTTKAGKKVFRLMIDTGEVLNHLEQGRTIIAYDILTNGGTIKTISGNKNGKSWKALQYYSWGLKPKDKEEK